MQAIESLARDPRVQIRRSGAPHSQGRCVVYWMQRAQRASDNPALDTAIEVANTLKLPIVAFLGIVPFYPNANLRHYHFLQQGIAEIAVGLAQRNVGFVFRPYPDHSLKAFCDEVTASIVIGDENPLREPERWRRVAAERLTVPLWTVDADVIVPAHLLLKEQFAARTIRPRIHALLPQFLIPGKEPRAHHAFDPHKKVNTRPVDFDFLSQFPIDRSVNPVPQIHGGAAAAKRALDRFLTSAASTYDERRNHPEDQGTSQLSPYLHFGHIGPRSVALAVKDADLPEADKAAFLEQLIVRRELAINFCHFNRNYDSLAGCERWALASLKQHERDPRPVKVSDVQMERAESPDPLWNAGQTQMVELGWMHNYVRMYWAKKILEWSPSPEEAFRIAVRLNDTYLLDGRDPNGYTGIAWSVGGKHDRPWFDRPIFGTIRYMSLASTSKKFDSKSYINRWRRTLI